VAMGGVAAPAAGSPAPVSGSQQAGDLDRSFGGDGKVVTSVAGGFDQARALAVVQGGKLVAAGSASDPQNLGATDFGLVRYNRNGSVDRSFGDRGKVITDFADNADDANALLAQPDGKLVAAGRVSTADGTTTEFGLVRYNRDGSLDRSFGTGGKVSTDLGENDVVNALVLQPDGKLVAAGSSLASDRAVFALARYNRNGTLDTSFGTGGKVITDFTGDDQAYALVLQADGKLVAAGGPFDFKLARYNRNGTLDTSFGTGGKVITDFDGGVDRAGALVVQDGMVVAAGSTTTGFALARYHRDGTLDTSFGTGGKVITDGTGEAHALIAQGNKLIAAGTGGDFVLARYHRNGALDRSFGTGGKVTTDFGTTFEEANSLVLQADGKLVAAGSAFLDTGMGSEFALARYHTS